MPSYELMTIHRPELAESDLKSRVTELTKALGERGVEINNTDIWGKRRFAYEIDHLNEGYYTVIEFEAEPEAVTELDRMLSLDDDVVRHKIVRPGA